MTAPELILELFLFLAIAAFGWAVISEELEKNRKIKSEIERRLEGLTPKKKEIADGKAKD